MAEHIGARIAARRQAVHMTQAVLEARAGLPATSLAKIEAGTRDVSATELRVLARVLRIGMEELIGTDDAPDALTDVLAEMRAKCSAKQRRVLAELLRGLADELAPV